MSSDINRFGLAGAIAALAVATLLACNPEPRSSSHSQLGEALNLTAQTGAQALAGATFSVHRISGNRAQLRLKTPRGQVLELEGGPQFSVVQTVLDDSVRGEQFFVASTIQDGHQLRHIGWVVLGDRSDWQLLPLPFHSVQPIRPPVDINEDGRREFVLADTGFGSLQVADQRLGGPERYFIVKDGEVIDHSAHEQYDARRHQKQTLARQACQTFRTLEACSLYAAWSAHAHNLDKDWSVILGLADMPRVSVCRHENRIDVCEPQAPNSLSLTVPEAIQIRLAEAGYTQPVYLNFPDDTDTSFGCDQANTIAERTICGDEALMALERREAAASFRSLALSEDRASVFDSRMSFLAQRNRTIGSVALTELYNQRLSRLGA